jgi:hypothetical protein
MNEPLIYRICPHWYAETHDYIEPVMYEITKQERCRICGKYRTFARVPEPHPTRDKEQLKEQLESKGSLVVDEWADRSNKIPNE